MAHTSGPWTTETDRRFRSMESMQLPESIGVRGPDGNFLASAFDFNRTDRDAEVEANARLISAAPDLLSALEAMHEEFAASFNNGNPIGYTIGSLKRALAALAIAEAAIDKATGR